MSDAKKWKSRYEMHQEGLRYMQDRRSGKEKSLKTPWSKWDDAGLDGIEWGSIVTVAGRPASGKTAIVNQITRRAHELNPDQDFAVLDFQLEMTSRSTAIREFSSVADKSYKQLLGVGGKIDTAIIDKLANYAEKVKDSEVFQVDEACSVEEMRAIILDFLREKKKATIVTLDHSILLDKDATEKDIFDTLYALGKMMTALKKKFPVIFIILTQMNRSIEEQSRKAPGTVANYPTSADIFGADALLMHSDIVAVINSPFKMGIEIYGPEQFEVDPKLIAIHFLKTRNGDNKLVFFHADFERMRVIQREAPGRVQVQTRRKSGLSTANL